MSAYEFVLAFIGGGAVMAVIQIVREVVDRKSAKSLALQFLLLDHIRNYAAGPIQRQTITPEELKEWLEMHKTYKKLGGNGYADELKEKITRLPLDLGGGKT